MDEERHSYAEWLEIEEREVYWQRFMDTPTPVALDLWCAEEIQASFPRKEQVETYMWAMEYVEWLETL